MATTMDFSQTYDFPPAAVREMISDPDFIAERATRTGSTSVDIEVAEEPNGSTTVIVERVIEPAEITDFHGSAPSSARPSHHPTHARSDRR